MSIIGDVLRPFSLSYGMQLSTVAPQFTVLRTHQFASASIGSVTMHKVVNVMSEAMFTHISMKLCSATGINACALARVAVVICAFVRACHCPDVLCRLLPRISIAFYVLSVVAKIANNMVTGIAAHHVRHSYMPNSLRLKTALL